MIVSPNQIRIEARGPVVDLARPSLPPFEVPSVQALMDAPPPLTDGQVRFDFDASAEDEGRPPFTVVREMRFSLPRRDARVPDEWESFVVPDGFQTDLMSLGRAGRIASALYGLPPYAGTVQSVGHDYLRSLAGADPKMLRVSDEWFRAALEQTTTLDERACWVIYRCVQGHALTVVHRPLFKLALKLVPPLALKMLERAVS